MVKEIMYAHKHSQAHTKSLHKYTHREICYKKKKKDKPMQISSILGVN